MSLKTRLIEQITLEGPMSVAAYMARCLLDPIDGYYMKRPALGADGDFLTAPMISQMFGEMIGVWVARTWQSLGSPAHFRLVEFGGGDGTLMSDIMRVAKRVPGLDDAAEIVMIEPSPVLRNLQSQKIDGAIFVPGLESVNDDLPLIIIANEVLDCLPASQFVRVDGEWHERLVGLDTNGELCFGLANAPSTLPESVNFENSAIFEYSAEQVRFARRLCDKIKTTTGAALLIDYGRDRIEAGDTLQALFRHAKHAPLEAPGEHDLTVWANFPVVARAAHNTGLAVSKITPQGTFLRRMGIEARLEALSTGHPAQADKLQRQYERLVAPGQMGDLFKVLAFAWPKTIALTGLEADEHAP